MSYNESLGSRGAEEARNDHGEIFMGPFFFTKIQKVRREMQPAPQKKSVQSRYVIAHMGIAISSCQATAAICDMLPFVAAVHLLLV